ncbi:MAG: flagellar biosynthetic protein FliQ [Oscillospiraceae bacterium]|nr:flagellar biosynthetic protein FliQ [Oscillospiraceae bacterium]
MTISVVNEILHETLMVALKLAGPILVSCMLVGIVIALFQAVTQVHEQSLGFIMKIVVVILFLFIGGGWMLQTLQEYTYHVFELMVR